MTNRTNEKTRAARFLLCNGHLAF